MNTAAVFRAFGSTLPILAAVAGTTLLPVPSAMAGMVANEPRRVLIVESFGRDFAVWNAVPPTFKPELARQVPWPIEFHAAALETARSDQPEAEAAFAGYLRALYAARRLDLVVPVGAPAAQFWFRHRAVLFPHAPVLIGDIDQRMMRSLSLGPEDTAVVAAQLDLAACFEILGRLFPATTHLAMVMGDSPLEKLWVEECRRAFEPYTDRIRVLWLNGLAFPEICERAANLPPGAVIAYGSMLVDAAGVPYEQMEALERLCAVANAPVFGTEEEQLGHGIIGGSLVSGRALGRETARVAARILRGEAPPSIATEVIRAGPPLFDWRQLQRWQISESMLPTGSIVRFRPPSTWERYRWHVVGAVGIMFVQAVTIIGLIVHRTRRRAAEHSARELAGRLIGVQEHERGDIAAQLHDGLGQDLLVIASQAQLSLNERGNPPGTVTRLNDIVQTARQAIHQARRMAHDLRPGLLDELGLTKAIRATAEKAAQASGMSIELVLTDVDGLLSPEFEMSVFRIVQELLNNVLKHARATQANVAVARTRGQLRVTVADNGCGFDPKRVESVAPHQRGLGLHEIAERAKMMQGRVTIESRPGQGTRITVGLPTSAPAHAKMGA